ncbi:MAG TPA: universal stress protein, partial [Candidatus Binatia bacterium]
MWPSLASLSGRYVSHSGGSMIKKILAPTDLSKFSRAGVRYALNKARASGAEVIIYHV